MNFTEQTNEPFHLPETLSAGKAGQKIKKIAQAAVSKDSATYRFNQTEILQSLLRTHKIVTVEAHKLKGFFLPVILAKAKMLGRGRILLIKQAFEPVPLYSVLGKLGFLYHTKKVNNEYHVYFVRKDEINFFNID